MSDIKVTGGTPSGGIPEQVGQLRGKSVGEGTGTAQTKKPVPASASPGKLSVRTLLQRKVEVADRDQITIDTVSRKMRLAADQYSRAIDKALLLPEEEQKEAIGLAISTLSRNTQSAFAHIDTSGTGGVIEELKTLNERMQTEPEEVKKDFEKKIKEQLADVEKLYTLIVFTECIKDPARMTYINNRMEAIRNIYREEGVDAGALTIALGSSYEGAIGREGAIGKSMIQIMETTKKFLEVEGLQDFKSKTDTMVSLFKALTFLFAITVLFGILFGSLWAHYDSKGEDADKRLKDLLRNVNPQEQWGLSPQVLKELQDRYLIDWKNMPHETLSLQDRVNTYMAYAYSEAMKSTNLDENAVRERFCDKLAEAYMEEVLVVADPNRTSDQKFAAFNDKINLMLEGDLLSKTKAEFLAKVKEKFSERIMKMIDGINRGEALTSDKWKACEEAIKLIPDALSDLKGELKGALLQKKGYRVI